MYGIISLFIGVVNMDNETKEKITKVLLSSFPREFEDKSSIKPTESIKNEYHVIRYENNSILKITVLVATILLFICFTSNTLNVPIYNNNTITNNEAHTIQQLVAIVADCEQKTANTIHAELKKEFNYNSYKRINKSTYYKISSYLSKRNCKPYE